MDEKMHIIFPGMISNNPNSNYKNISEEINDLKNLIINKIEEDMSLRSNFEFSSDNKNLLKDSNFNKKIQLGISILRNYNIINSEIENNIRERLN
jgi:hypothetical protein